MNSCPYDKAFIEQTEIVSEHFTARDSSRIFEVMRQPPPSVETAVVDDVERQGQRWGTQIDVGGRIGK